jgi:hypothetical protein
MVRAALGVALAASASVALAGHPDLRIQVTAVRATESGPSDPQLVSLRPRLRRLVGYRAFQVVNREERPCGWRTESRFALPGGRLLKVLPKDFKQDMIQLQVRLLEDRRRLVDTSVKVMDGGTMIFGVGRPRSGEEALLILLKTEMD